ncbi:MULTISPECIES: hypothetical protein [Mycobacterium avium complex (MAC)]|uniref:CRISPR type AFERR-associated protein Csf3 n=1 Tax=Mycobacterium intracellulare subsp. chimaera TaxID=222805 RepID=A0ABT7P3I9_MYCIT|nr:MULTISPECIES: hypothetical protein [Mycobacterium avium complex (MAC)]AOS94735.1 hypothetical protein AN480_26935 [Mycobacterium intracellulare subsp. chimaera]MDM3927860.1 hypothetical protein [Mycobacterium intracellulare subsp. chimaera]PBA69161.1 hypothetical protein CKJ76_24370 [Mycobacterium avium]
MSFRQLIVTAFTPHGVVLSRPWGPALDGLLASVLWHRMKWAARESGNWLTYDPDQPPQPIDLPLARCGDPDHDPDWHWMATFADLHPHHSGISQPDVRWRTSRTDRQRLQQLATTISSRTVSKHSGRYQDRTIPVTAHPATSLTWRAVGDPDVIRDLLADLRSIGKHRNSGQGRITTWDVTETPDVAEWFAGHEHEPGVLGRTVPPRCLRDATTGEIGAPGIGALRPPYHHHSSRTSIYQPAR